MSAPPELRTLAEDVFTAVAKTRFVSVGSLLAYAGPQGLTLALLDAWCRAGLLTRATVQSNPLKPETMEYVALTIAGARTLAAATGHAVQGITPARLKRSSQKRMHDVWVGEVALAVTSLAKDGLVDLVGIETDDRKLVNVIHICQIGKEPERIVLQPDALIVTKGRHGNEALLVEVDRGTTAPKRMQIRYRGYLSWQTSEGPARHFGIKALRVLTLVPNEARLERLHKAAFEANHDRRSGFLTFGLLDNFTVCTAERWLAPSVRPLGSARQEYVPALSPAPGHTAPMRAA